MNENEIREVLESIGLQKNETLIYLDLIKNGGSSAHDIAGRTKIHRPNVYDNIDKLKKKSIITESVKNGKKIFYPVKPKNLINYLKEKQYELEKAIPEMESLHNKPSEKRTITMSEGIRSFRNILNGLLDKNHDIFVYGIPKGVADKIGGFINEFHESRVKKKITMKHIYNKDAERRIRFLNDMEFTEARFLPSMFNTNITTLICGDVVLLTFWDEPMFIITIENQSVADAYKGYFNILWEEAKIMF